jgi:hypothetical protein
MASMTPKRANMLVDMLANSRQCDRLGAASVIESAAGASGEDARGWFCARLRAGAGHVRRHKIQIRQHAIAAERLDEDSLGAEFSSFSRVGASISKA